MKLCLVNLKFERGNITNFRRQEHIGLGYIGAMCEQEGHEVKLVNAQFTSTELEEVKQSIVEQKPKVLGLTMYEELLDDSIELLKYAKSQIPDIVIIVGGHYATFNAENVLKRISEIDFISAGEGEISFVQLLNALENGDSVDDIKGIWYSRDGKFHCNGMAEVVCDLDKLPYPLREKIDRRNRITNISASRGCYGNCSFCSTKAFYQNEHNLKIRIRNPISVVNEIEYMVKRDNAYHFFFTDDNFMVTEILSKGWIQTFVQEIKKRDINIVFNFDCRVNDVDKDLMKQLKSVGLIGVFLGVESCSPNTLKLYSKSTSNELNVKAVSILRRARIDYWIGNIMFHPLTTLEDITYDINYFNEIHYCLFFNYSNPIMSLAGKLKVYKGTAIYEDLIKRGYIQDDGLTSTYQFVDKKVSQFYDFICEAKNIVSDLVELDPIFMIEMCNKNELTDISNEIHTISRRYMELDFELFCKAHSFLMENDDYEKFCEYTKQIMEDARKKADELYKNLSTIHEELVRRSIVNNENRGM